MAANFPTFACAKKVSRLLICTFNRFCSCLTMSSVAGFPLIAHSFLTVVVGLAAGAGTLTPFSLAALSFSSLSLAALSLAAFSLAARAFAAFRAKAFRRSSLLSAASPRYSSSLASAFRLFFFSASAASSASASSSPSAPSSVSSPPCSGSSDADCPVLDFCTTIIDRSTTVTPSGAELSTSPICSFAFENPRLMNERMLSPRARTLGSNPSPSAIAQTIALFPHPFAAAMMFTPGIAFSRTGPVYAIQFSIVMESMAPSLNCAILPLPTPTLRFTPLHAKSPLNGVLPGYSASGECLFTAFLPARLASLDAPFDP
ncbi:uncharacterized protein BcabD6B2_47480 [Babesia caballi]|uniref:Uncharacterized protein n=1 Tax=Babesia caballi TaxID=5871 RepID=A0AAV4M002_BABCB|nr:hypothetical protein BcabD6B2_47480 [Babesia caballi]